MSAYNPRYVAYATAHEHTVESMLEHDRNQRQGGAMVGFLLWNRKKLREFGEVFPEAFLWSHLSNHAAYDLWLQESVNGEMYGRGVLEPQEEVFV